MDDFDKQLDELKRKLIFEDKFSDTYNYFFDCLGENIDFMRLGKRDKSPDLKKIIQAIGESVFHKEVIITRFLLTRLPKQRFYHGGYYIDGRLSTLFFFREVSMGMAAIIHPESDVNVSFVRFTVFESPSKHLTLKDFSKPTLH